MEEINWARLAMAIDGEGSISIAKQVKRDAIRHYPYQYSLLVSVYNTNYILVDWVQYHFGASIAKTDRRVNNHKAEYAAYFRGQDAALVIENVMPYLLLKQEQAEVALEFQSTVRAYGNRTPLSPETLDYREQLYLKMKSLNKRGRDSD